MDLNERKVSLTYSLNGKYFIQRGKYKSAGLNKEGNVVAPMRILRLPKYKEAVIHTTLNNTFIENCLERPKNPFKNKNKSYFRWLRSEKGKLFLNFNKLSIEQKLRTALEIYVQDLTGDKNNLLSYTVI